MYELTEADRIWNRACSDDRRRALPGDRALVDMLYAHGLAMNGGVFHAIECMTVEEQVDAEAGYRYYGLDSVACLMSRARRILDTADDPGIHERQLDGEYLKLVPSDSSLSERFESRLKSKPNDFEALRAND